MTYSLSKRSWPHFVSIPVISSAHSNEVYHRDMIVACHRDFKGIEPRDGRYRARRPSYFNTQSHHTLLKIGRESALQALLNPIMRAIFIPAGWFRPGIAVVVPGGRCSLRPLGQLRVGLHVEGGHEIVTESAIRIAMLHPVEIGD